MTTAVEDEFAVLESIFDSMVSLSQDQFGTSTVKYVDGENSITLFIPLEYPNSSPTFKLGWPRSLVDDRTKNHLCDELQRIINDGNGAEVLFQVIDHYRQRVMTGADYTDGDVCDSEAGDNSFALDVLQASEVKTPLATKVRRTLTCLHSEETIFTRIHNASRQDVTPVSPSSYTAQC